MSLFVHPADWGAFGCLAQNVDIFFKNDCVAAYRRASIVPLTSERAAVTSQDLRVLLVRNLRNWLYLSSQARVAAHFYIYHHIFYFLSCSDFCPSSGCTSRAKLCYFYWQTELRQISRSIVTSLCPATSLRHLFSSK